MHSGNDCAQNSAHRGTYDATRFWTTVIVPKFALGCVWLSCILGTQCPRVWMAVVGCARASSPSPICTGLSYPGIVTIAELFQAAKELAILKDRRDTSQKYDHLYRS